MPGKNPEFVCFGPFRFLPGNGLWRHDELLSLPPQQLQLLAALVAAPWGFLSKDDLMHELWPDTNVNEDSSLAKAIGGLREALGDSPWRPTYIQTEHGRGYRFIGLLTDVPQSEESNPACSSQSLPSVPEWRASPVVDRHESLSTTTSFSTPPVDGSGTRPASDSEGTSPLELERGSALERYGIEARDAAIESAKHSKDVLLQLSVVLAEASRSGMRRRRQRSAAIVAVSILLLLGPWAWDNYRLNVGNFDNVASRWGALASHRPTVDIKVNESDGPVTLAAGVTYEYRWISANATACMQTGPEGSSGISLAGRSGAISADHPFYPAAGFSVTLTVACSDGSRSGEDSVIVRR